MCLAVGESIIGQRVGKVTFDLVTQVDSECGCGEFRL